MIKTKATEMISSFKFIKVQQFLLIFRLSHTQLSLMYRHELIHHKHHSFLVSYGLQITVIVQLAGTVEISRTVVLLISVCGHTNVPIFSGSQMSVALSTQLQNPAETQLSDLHPRNRRDGFVDTCYWREHNECILSLQSIIRYRGKDTFYQAGIWEESVLFTRFFLMSYFPLTGPFTNCPSSWNCIYSCCCIRTIVVECSS